MVNFRFTVSCILLLPLACLVSSLPSTDSEDSVHASFASGKLHVGVIVCLRMPNVATVRIFCSPGSTAARLAGLAPELADGGAMYSMFKGLPSFVLCFSNSFRPIVFNHSHLQTGHYLLQISYTPF
ncbi:hypothetical protein BU17DRAFT_68017 [Hysterangium stoloniferum]|nr:hypothetical protein BU17DRAFT_68017 [Hysterangium stoloniferum]